MTQKTLFDFIKQRLSELDTKYTALYDAGIGAQALTNIKRGKVSGLRGPTLQKLAFVLQVSQGDLQAIISQMPEVTPFGEQVSKGQKPSVMETVDKLEELVKAEYPEAMESATKPEETEAKVEPIKAPPEKYQ